MLCLGSKQRFIRSQTSLTGEPHTHTLWHCALTFIFGCKHAILDDKLDYLNCFQVVLMLADVRFLVCLLWCLSSETSSASHLLNFCFNSTFNLFLLLLQETGLFLFRPQVQIIFIDKEKVNYLVLDVFLLLYDGQGVSQYFPS